MCLFSRYAKRPECVDDITLAQFSRNYSFTTRIPKRVAFESNGASIDEISFNRTIIGSDVEMPRYLRFEEGYFRLREIPAILRIHSSRKKEGHEQHYSELLLFTPWRNEAEELERDNPEACIQLYNDRSDAINSVKAEIFPGEDTLELLETDLELIRPSHIYDEIDGQFEQENEDDFDEGLEDDPRYAALEPETSHKEEDKPSLEQIRYKKLKVPDEEELKAITHRLADEQMEIVTKVVTFCKGVVKSRNCHKESVEPLRLVVHGGKTCK